MADLRTDYKDDLLDTSVNTQRKYRMVTNDDGTVSFVDETVYAQNGDTFGASEVNQIHAAVNLVNESLTVDTTELSEDYSLNGLLQMLAEKYFPNATYLFKDGVLYGDTFEVTNQQANGYITLADNLIKFGFTDGVSCYANTCLKAKDLTNYSKLVVNITSVSNNCGVYFGVYSTPPTNHDAQPDLLCQTLTTGVHELNISSISGNAYVGFKTYCPSGNSGSGYISEIELQ